jgi:UDP-N-acetylmuramyl tripeptide synthase
MINTHSKINSNILVQDKNIYKKISKFRYRIEFLDDFSKSQEINLINKNYYSYLVKTKNRNYSINTMHDFMIQNFLSMLHIFFKLHKKFPEKVNTKIFPDGRSEIIYKKNNMIILVDYAHTKEAFENLLSNLPRDELHKIIIFGCGGNRDKSKRSKMAKVASKYTDIQIITDDNPRNENPSSIRKTLCQNSSNYIEIPSRQRAIERGVKLLKKKKGLLVIAGKGHENIQIYKNKIFKFNDRKVAKSYAKSL